MPTCDRCKGTIQGPKLYSDPLIHGGVLCKSCYNITCADMGRHELVDK